MKSLLNRRSVLSGPSHLVPVAPDSAATATLPLTGKTAPHAPPVATSAADADPLASAESHAAGNPQPARPVTALRPVPVMPSSAIARGVHIAHAAEVEWLADEEALTPFRVFRSFAYSVSLLFHAKELAYYVALYQDGSLWRALKTADLEAAESAFRHFEDQATRLSDGETRRAQLEAQNEQLARLIARSEEQAERMRRDLHRHGSQEQAVAGRQHQIRKEVSQLEAQRVAGQAHLNKVQRQLHQLNLTSSEGIPHLPAR
ncbi:DUF2968 domain-containing protein [Paraburkholderia sp. BCC1886]|uniref:DUF2968 domain-containing protein n=1 Tax=Paraburkholderia sp. BCC1886 TaxID=2562670 RepID=UPI0011826DF4|nr:DUF2968 domain-containing protein [Paraburkholderia sp. BCC1886]